MGAHFEAESGNIVSFSKYLNQVVRENQSVCMAYQPGMNQMSVLQLAKDGDICPDSKVVLQLKTTHFVRSRARLLGHYSMMHSVLPVLHVLNIALQRQADGRKRNLQ